MEKKNAIDLDREQYLSLKKKYAKAVGEGREQFTFEGRILLTSYAKYLLEFLTFRFEKEEK